MVLVFWRQISSAHSNSMTKFKVRYKRGRKNVVFSIKTACRMVSNTAKVTIDRTIISNSYISFRFSIGTTFDDLEWHLKVISAYVAIPTLNISEIIYDSSRETKIANKKSHDSFQATRLSMTLVVFHNVIRLFHIKFLVNGAWYGKSYYRLLMGIIH